MKETVILRGQRQMSALLGYLDKVPLDDPDNLHEVIIREHEENLSSRQRAYYFVILGAIGKHTGSGKEALHIEYKKKFLIDIFASNPEQHVGYGEMMDALREIWRQGMKDHAQKFYDYVVRETSIMDATKEEMAEYIDKIIIHAADFLSFAVPPPRSGSLDELLNR